MRLNNESVVTFKGKTVYQFWFLMTVINVIEQPMSLHWCQWGFYYVYLSLYGTLNCYILTQVAYKTDNMNKYS